MIYVCVNCNKTYDDQAEQIPTTKFSDVKICGCCGYTLQGVLKNSPMEMPESIKCPFCDSDDDYDKPALAGHISTGCPGYCEAMKELIEDQRQKNLKWLDEQLAKNKS